MNGKCKHMVSKEMGGTHVMLMHGTHMPGSHACLLHRHVGARVTSTQIHVPEVFSSLGKVGKVANAACQKCCHHMFGAVCQVRHKVGKNACTQHTH